MNNANAAQRPHGNKSNPRVIGSHNAAQRLSTDHFADPARPTGCWSIVKIFSGTQVIMTMFRFALLATTALTVAHLAIPAAQARNADAPLVVAQGAPPAETGPDGKPKQPPKGTPPKGGPTPPPAAAPPHPAPPPPPAAAPPHPPAPPPAAPPPPP